MATTREIKRQCVRCGKYIKIKLEEQKPLNAYYFGRMKLPVGKGKWIETSKKILTNKTEVKEAEWTGRMRTIEYWECEKCYYE